VPSRWLTRGLRGPGAILVAALSVSAFLHACRCSELSSPKGDSRARKPSAGTPGTSRRASALEPDEFAKILLASHWRGSLRGTLVFSRSGGVGKRQLKAELRAKTGRTISRLQSVELASMGSLVLEQQVKVGDVTVTTTFYGALRADKKTIEGSYQRTHGDPPHRSRHPQEAAAPRKGGRWHVEAVPLATAR